MCNSLRPTTIKLLQLPNLASVDNVIETAFYDTSYPRPKTATVFIVKEGEGEREYIFFSFFHFSENEIYFSI